MPDETPRDLLVATDLTPACDVVLRAAAVLAAHTGAALHVLHVVEGGGFLESDEKAEERRREAGDELDRQIARSLPDGVEVASRQVRSGAVHREVVDLAEEVAPGLLVFGPHGGGAADARFLGSTADRLLRTSRIPCLVVRQELELPLRRVGVPVDLSDASFEALRAGFRWAETLTRGAAEQERSLRLVHVGWPVTQIDLPDYEADTLRPQLATEAEAAAEATASRIPYEIDVLWDNLAGETICRWAQKQEVGLLILATHGRSGLPRALLGSVATEVTRDASCSVLLVPPSAESTTATGSSPPTEVAAPQPPDRATSPALDRVLVATDFSLGALEAANWVAEHFAPEADLDLAHVAQVPYPPAFLRQGLPAREELVSTALAGARERLERTARELPRAPRELFAREGRSPAVLAELASESGGDLLVVGGHGRREGLWANLGSTAESLLGTSPVPVLVARGVEAEPPRHLLLPLDDSDDARAALAWGVFLADRLEARITLLHVVSSGLLGSIRRISSEPAARELEERMNDGLERWLGDLAEATGLPAGRVATLVETGVPQLQILATAARLGCDLIVVGSRGSGGARLGGLGSVASSVVHHGGTPVLVVPPRR